jgi:hypothetical protein
MHTYGIILGQKGRKMTVQVVQALNFTGFQERNDLISYKNLFASQAPELTGKPLGEYLTKLDQAEYLLVSAENQELTQDVSGSWDKRVIAVPLLAAAYLVITILFHEKLGLLLVNNLYKETFHVAGFVAFFISLCMFVGCAYAPMYRQIARENKVHQINESRKDRLAAKLIAVRAEYRKLKDASSSLATKSPQQIELRDAKSFLKDRIVSLTLLS